MKHEPKNPASPAKRPAVDRPLVIEAVKPGQRVEASPDVQSAFAEMRKQSADLAAVRERLARDHGPRFWRSLDELADDESFREMVKTEFPQMAASTDSLDRRSFLKLMGASMAMMGLTACTKQPEELIVPYVTPPEDLVPGKPMQFATIASLSGFAQGVLATSHMGRPTKIEGNPDHPSSLGATDGWMQASILDLYDPDRSQAVIDRGRVSTWERATTAITRAMNDVGLMEGEGLSILTETVTSPTLAAMLEELLETYPKAKWHQYDPVSRDGVYAGAQLAFNRKVDTVYRFDRADVVLSLDSDFLGSGPGHVRYARDFASRRKLDDEGADLNRLYVVESGFTLTGTNADHRLPVRSQDIESFTRALARELGLATLASDTSRVTDSLAPFFNALVEDLQAHRGRCLVVAGEHQPAEVHALVHVINALLQNVGTTLDYIEPVPARPGDQMDSIRELTEDMEAGKIRFLFMLGGNPVYNAPADLRFAEQLELVPLRLHLGTHVDETSFLSHWHITMTHELEAWGDGRAFDGTASICQPLIEPLYQAKSAIEVVAAMLGRSDRSGLDLVRDYWLERLPDGNPETEWRRALHNGVIGGTAFAPLGRLPISFRLLPRDAVPVGEAVGPRWASATSTWDDLEIVLRPDASMWDGRFANNGWLQETPRPVTRVCWGNVIEVSPSDAERMSLDNEDVVEISSGDFFVAGPVWVSPGQARGSITVTLGYGRQRAGKVGDGVGFDAYRLLSTQEPAILSAGRLIKTGRKEDIANVQKHQSMENRALIRAATLDTFRHHPDFAQHMEHEPPESLTMYKPPFDYSVGNQWGMVINLNACIGCNACMVACQAENTIPVVGKKEVMNGREMHWIRVDRYYEGNPDTPTAVHQPVPCMHCENAPCETVCPVGATVHSHDGLNQMVYNRCVGTRYCSNNCPYKVRRFNFFQYHDRETLTLKMQRNPHVTVRPRGVMEKCTYCIQRISVARIEAKLKGRLVEEGEVVTACQQACPTRAISFGDINDPDSEVARLRNSPLNYGLLADLNTRPRTTYLAKVTNPNPALAGGHGHEEGHGHGGHG